jgi:hypothetical protein
MKGSKTGWVQPAIQDVDLFGYPFEKTKSIFNGRVTASQGGILTIKFPLSLEIEIIEGQDLFLVQNERRLSTGFKVLNITRSPLTDAVTLKAELSSEFGEMEGEKPEDYLTNWKDPKVQVIPLVAMKEEHLGASLVLTVAPKDPSIDIANIGHDKRLPGPADPLFWDQNNNGILDQEEGKKIEENLQTKIDTADGFNHLNIGFLIPATNIVGFAKPSFTKYFTNCRTVIAHIKPIADLLTITINR